MANNNPPPSSLSVIVTSVDLNYRLVRDPKPGESVFLTDRNFEIVFIL